MKIEKVEGLLIGSDLIGTNFVVRITTDSGLTGIGQSGAWGFPDAAAAVVDQFREYLIGEDPFKIDHIQQSLYRMRPFRGNILSGALSAIDIALWDIKGKHYGAPVWDLLGGKYRDKVRLHLLLPLQSTDEEQVFKSSREAAEEGFTAIKLDPLRAGYADQTLSRLIEGARGIAAAAREGAGHGRRPDLRDPPQADPDERGRPGRRAGRVPAAVLRGPDPDRLDDPAGADRQAHGPAGRQRRAHEHGLGVPRPARSGWPAVRPTGPRHRRRPDRLPQDRGPRRVVPLRARLAQLPGPTPDRGLDPPRRRPSRTSSPRST